MSSILKVNTIQDLDGNLIISKDSGGSGFLSPYASSSAAITYTVTVASKTSAHPYFGVGSSNGYFINGIESPIIEIKGNDTSKPYHYKFDQSDSSNSGHPLLFYNNVGKTTGFSTGVTTNGTPGQAGAYTMIAVDSQTPNILYYQCSSHANMGNHTFATSPVVNTGVFLTLPTADGSSGQVVTTNGSGVLSFADATAGDITSVVAGTGLSGGGTSGDVTLNVEAAQSGITSLGTITTFRSTGIDDNADALAMTIDSSENVGIGETVPLGKLHVKSGDSGVSSADITDLVVECSGSGGMSLLGATNGQVEIAFGDSGDANIGRIAYNNNGNYLATVVNASEATRIHSNGVLSASAGVALGVGTANTASNVLDDYEEGTFTPSFSNGNGFDSLSYAAQRGTYTKVGRIVNVRIQIELGANVSKNGNRIIIDGLPFTSSNAVPGGGLNWSYVNSKVINSTSTNIPTLWIASNSSAVNWYKTDGSNFTGNDISGSTTNLDIYINGTYQTDA